MRFVTFTTGAGAGRLGSVIGDEVVDLNAFEPSLSHDMASFLALGDQTISIAAAAAERGRVRHALGTIRLLAPVPMPRKIFGIGMNFSSFLEAMRRRGTLPPSGQRIWFNRQQACVAGPDEDIWLPQGSDALDYEGELAVVIGRRCRHVPVAAARQVIAGYTIGNDVTVRDWAASCPLLGKSFDTHAPMGPHLVTADALPDPHDLTITTLVNGQRRQSGSTAEMLSNCDELIAELSAVTTLEPGDIILTGTPDGCGVLQQPPHFLKVGDRVRIEIDGIGAIENQVVPELPLRLRGAA